MRQDRRLNGWVLISSIIEIILSVVLLSVGIALAIAGFMYTDKLGTITDLQVFVAQLTSLQSELFGKVLIIKYLYLCVGIVLAVIGLITLILSIVSLNYAQKKKVVRHRIALLIFALIPLAIVGCVTTYLLLEFDGLTDNIKYIVYGIIGAFGFVALCKILGVIFGRSEKFMSNDNNKYAFDNSSLRNARVDVNNNVKTAQQQYTQQVQAQSNRNVQGQPMRPVQSQNSAAMSQQRTQVSSVANAQMPQGAKPIQPTQQRPMQQPMRTTTRPVGTTSTQPNQTGVSRPVGTMQSNQNQRPIQPMRPVQGVNAQPRSTNVQSNGAQTQNSAVRRYCQKCGKLLNPQEKFCTLCGHLNKTGN